MTHTLVLTEALPQVGMRALSEHLDVNVRVLPAPDTTQLMAALPAADGVVMVLEQPSLTAEMLAGAGRLRVAARFGAGYDNIDVAALTSRGIPLVTTGDANTDAVAEHALYLMLALAKRGPMFDREVKAGVWNRRFGGSELRDRSCVVVGYGRIGRRIARLVSAFAMRVVVVDVGVAPGEVIKDGFHPADSLEAALRQADFVVMACAYTAATRHLLNADRLALLGPSAFVVNVARGPVIDERALTEAIVDRRIAGAGLDVLEQEPPRPDHPLLGLDNVVLTPHSAAYIETAYDRMARAAVDLVVRGLRGGLKCADVVNPAYFDNRSVQP